jgi:signal transduction histidine kinase
LVLWEQLEQLNLVGLDGCAIHVNDDSAGTFETFIAFPDMVDGKKGMKLGRYKFKQNCISVLQEWDRFYRAGEKKFSVKADKTQLNEFIDWFEPTLPFLAKEMRKKNLDHLYVNGVAFSNGILGAPSFYPLVEETWMVFGRMADVFDLAYRRFQDLQKAEAQTREAQIEAALERVRARSMAMQNSEELNQLIGQIYLELSKLDMVLTRTSLLIVEPDKKSTRWWMANSETPSKPMNFFVKYHTHPPYLAWLKAWQNREQKWVYHLKGKVKKEWDEYIFSETELSKLPDKVIQGMMEPDHVILTASFGNFGALEPASLEPLSDEQIDILIRFTKVFEQTYTRFLDLQKAEAQAREAQIEASLERIRARAMAMQKSDELREVVGLVSEELNISLENTICIIMNFDWKSKEIEWWSTGFNIDNLPESYKIPIRDTIKDHPLIRHYQEALRKGISYNVYKLEGEIKRSWDKYIFEQSELNKIPLETQNWMRSYEGVICNEAFMSHGVLEVDGPEQLSDEKAEILQRFAKVVDLTYTRVEDLQQAEARAIEAVRQASLDRVRGVIASMRTKEDLNRITPLIWKELKALDVPFIRCGVFIMDVENEIIQSYLSTPDGKSLGIFDMPFTSELIGELMVNFWQQGKIYKEHWTKDQFVKFMKRLKDTGKLKDTKSYQGAAVPPKNLDLHFIPFKQGMLYVGNTAPLVKKELQLAQSLADAFSIAYARYEDFRELELAKEQIEKALDELKATQSQLIHSEKMASLGELTAGIAHEIQNPLNFVNNFSEVSEDLIDEMLEGLLDGNKEEVENIITDLKQNLQKINHHGKRASSIVHGMLEHSRTGKQEMEPTDINLLADEYLRLAYHGLRAKNKSFNAEFKSELDESLPKVNVIAQDIGRVLLNLINNAFYAVDKKAKEGVDGYKPLVIVSTKKVGDNVEVGVKDNGPGIPEEIREKIFQPFFTTKPTGSGTGLGLSLSYDIVKAHGGEILFNSQKVDGTEFIIQLPVNN